MAKTHKASVRETANIVLTHGRAATVAPALSDAALVFENGRIAWIGSRGSLPERYGALAARDLQGRLVTPAFVDCHTHLIPEEALAGVTCNTAAGLGLADECGTLEAGKRADVAVFDTAQRAELAYHIGANLLALRISARN